MTETSIETYLNNIRIGTERYDLIFSDGATGFWPEYPGINKDLPKTA